MVLFQSPQSIALFDLVEQWVQITTDARHCLGRECPLVKQCFAERAKARAKEADIVIANHHLVLLDAALREQSDGAVTLLPEHDVLILDEAHDLEETATSVFGTEITGARWRCLLTQFSRLRKAMPDTVEELLAMADERDPVELDTLLDEAYQSLHEALTQADTLFSRAAHHVRAGHQPQDGRGPGPHHAPDAPLPGDRRDPISLPSSMATSGRLPCAPV